MVDNTVANFIGNGDGSFSLARTYFVDAISLHSISTGDFNQDGFADLYVRYWGDAADGKILFGDGSGVAIRDLNGDGSADLITSENATNTVSVFMSNGDGIYDIAAQNNQGGTPTLAIFLGNADSSGRRNNRLENIDLLTKVGAKQALASSRAQLTRIGQELGNIVAVQSRLSSANATLQTARENY